MLKTHVSPFTAFNEISIFDLGEETEAALHPDPLMQRAHYIIHFVLDGEGTYTNYNSSGETQVQLKKNTVFAIYKYDSVFYQSNRKNPLHYCWVGFDGTESEKILEYLGFNPTHLAFECKNPEKLYKGFLHLFETYKKKDKYRLLSDFFRLIYTLRDENPMKINVEHESKNDLFVRAENYIKMHIMENIKASDVAAFLHLDRSYFSTIFKAHFKISPYAYITQQKMFRAEVLLRTTNYSVQKIASLLSFTDVYAFSAFFKKHYGVSPKQFKKSLNGAKNEP